MFLGAALKVVEEEGLLSLSKPQHGPTDRSLVCSLLLVLLRWRDGEEVRSSGEQRDDDQVSESCLRAAFVFQGMLLASMEGRSISQPMEKVRYLRSRSGTGVGLGGGKSSDSVRTCFTATAANADSPESDSDTIRRFRTGTVVRGSPLNVDVDVDVDVNVKASPS